ncbi:YceI family protein [Flavobacterium tegetincola]|uniref:YceI family protein n=1 Tax=Flavobacterium tegetincola TaxID=150172 RepID=UPI00041B9DA6|nr:YceI family protein [Flavobacterium tegetincola]
MKNFKTIALAFVAFTATTLASAQTKKIDTSKSNITWVGKKVTGSHEGNIKFKEGALEFKGTKLTGGNFVVNMASIDVTDLKSGAGKEKLEGHLKSEDFFGTEKFPTGTLVFTKVAAKQNGMYTVTGDLTLKGITKPVTFDMVVNGSKATSALVVDRTKYDIKYNSGSFFDSLGDKVIYDNFDLAVELTF